MFARAMDKDILCLRVELSNGVKSANSSEWATPVLIAIKDYVAGLRGDIDEPNYVVIGGKMFEFKGNTFMTFSGADHLYQFDKVKEEFASKFAETLVQFGIKILKSDNYGCYIVEQKSGALPVKEMMHHVRGKLMKEMGMDASLQKDIVMTPAQFKVASTSCSFTHYDLSELNALNGHWPRPASVDYSKNEKPETNRSMMT